MTELKIPYSKKQTRLSLILGSIFCLLALIAFIADSNHELVALNVVIGSMHLATYFYYTQNPVITINADFVKVNYFLSKKILRNDIVEIKYFAGDYTIKSAKKKIVINTNFLDDSKKAELKSVIEEMISEVKTSEVVH